MYEFIVYATIHSKDDTNSGIECRYAHNNFDEFIAPRAYASSSNALL